MFKISGDYSRIYGVRELKNINFIQSAIMQLEGGAFQKLFDAYLYKKYKFKNIDIEIKECYIINADRNMLYTCVTELTFKRHVLSSATRPL